MTVIECAEQSKKTKIWLCPHEVKHPKFVPHPFLTGIECSKSTIPDGLKDKRVTKQYVDGGFQCIIWFNDLEEVDDGTL